MRDVEVSNWVEIISAEAFLCSYASSHLFNSQGGWNKRGGGAQVAKSINVEVGILQLESSPFVFK